MAELNLTRTAIAACVRTLFRTNATVEMNFTSLRSAAFELLLIFIFLLLITVRKLITRTFLHYRHNHKYEACIEQKLQFYPFIIIVQY
ncbi:hypothetical protein T03_974 [Trichinella britovi]|uniref:Uncharacterized protein n=1 Tax=Trichinella britovi TaxID=45882 RepID=A0A0V1CRA9_TRIBR|nr:hypothetical protein T03_974 [Trichinella britovi]